MNIIRVSVTFYCLQTNLLAVFSESCYSERSRRGFVLVNTTYNYSISDSFPSCIELCFNEPSCMSLNFWWDTKKCDLNNSTRENCRACFAEEPSSIYMGMGRYPGLKGSVPSVPGLSCKEIKDSGDYDISGNYWIRPVGSPDSFLAYCDMSAVGRWKKVTQELIENTFKGGVSLTYSENNDGLTISGSVTSFGCGQGPMSGALTLIKGYWTKIKYTQEFRGRSSCWSIFGDIRYGRLQANNQPTGIHPLDVSKGDTITNQYHMGVNTHQFDGRTTRCDPGKNFWQISRDVHYATVVLRRNLTAEKAGIFTGTSCGRPTYKIKNIFVNF